MTYVSDRREPVSTGPTRRGTIATIGGIVAAIAVAIALDSAVAAIAHVASVSHLFTPLRFANYTTLTVIGIGTGAAGWTLVRARATDPRRRLRVLAPVVVAASFAPDVVVGVSHRLTGTSWGGVAALMVMHLLVALVAVARVGPCLPYFFQQGAPIVNEAKTPHHHSSATAAGGDLNELLDLDAVMTRDYWNEVMAWIEASGPDEIRRIVDLGSGTGVGTISLAERFDHAEVFAIDASNQMLEATSRKASEQGHANRIKVIQADLDSAWPDINLIDLTWASMSLHHLGHPEELIRRIYAATRPGGQIAVAEFTEPVRFLPHDLGFGVPGLEQRCVEAFRQERLRSLPNFGLQWGERLEQVGFSAVKERVFALMGGGEDPSLLARYAWLWLERVASAAARHLSDEDLAALEELLADNSPHSLRRRHDLQIQGSRVVVRATKQ